MNSVTPDATFVASTRGRILLSIHRPASARACVLLAPPFAEEMNKSRRMFALLGEQLARQGLAAVLPDLFGTGDSEGEFADASWDCWRQDLARAATWAESELAPVTALVALRLGAELAADTTESGLLPGVQRVVLWQPVFDRARHLTQFLRLRTAAALTQEDRKDSDGLKQQLQQGRAVEVAGYELPPALASSMLASTARGALPSGWTHVHWIEIQRDPRAALPLPSRKLVDGARAAGAEVASWVTTGEPFWASTEIVTNAAILTRSVEALVS